MLLFDWIRSMFSERAKAIFTYKRGMQRAKKKDHQGAIEDYTTTIESGDTPNDIRAMALYNRALEWVATGEKEKGAQDLDTVLAMERGPANVKSMAKKRLIRLESKERTSHK